MSGTVTKPRLPILLLLLTALLWLVATPTLRAAESTGDGKDHPLLSRMPGYTVLEKSVKDFDAVSLKDYEIKGKLPGARFPLVYDGRVTTLKYIDEKQATSNLAVFRNYAAAIRKLGGRQLNAGFEPTSDDLGGGTHVFELPKAGATPTMVLLFINSPQWYSLTFVEPKPMAQEVQGGRLAEDLRAKGVATLYINFDTNKSELKDDGVAAVTQIAALMAGDASLKLSIEGHTDNVGSATANRKLSAERARSVMQAVVGKGIAASRLGAKGFGADVPVADNRTDDGRAKNRRVELVKVK